MKKLISFLVFIGFVLSGCTFINSNSNQNTVKGTLLNASDEPLQNIEIHAVYLSEEPTKTDEQNLAAYPNPFTGSTSVNINISESEVQYVLKAVNLKSMEEIEIINRNMAKGTHSVQFKPEEKNLSNGIYRLIDNRGEHRDVLFPTTINTKMSFNNNVNKPNTAGEASGRLIGKTVATTDIEGKFSFSVEELFFIDEPHKIIRTDETGFELGMFQLSSTISVVAYFDENNYAYKNIDLKQDRSHDLELVIY